MCNTWQNRSNRSHVWTLSNYTKKINIAIYYYVRIKTISIFCVVNVDTHGRIRKVLSFYIFLLYVSYCILLFLILCVVISVIRLIKSVSQNYLVQIYSCSHQCQCPDPQLFRPGRWRGQTPGSRGICHSCTWGVWCKIWAGPRNPRNGFGLAARRLGLSHCETLININ